MKTYSLLFFFFTFSLLSNGQVSQASRYIDSFVQKNNFNGTILIQQDAKITYQKSFGFANIPFSVPNTPFTKYKVASITKAFTAVMILQLWEQKKLELDNPIKNYLPGYKGPAADKVTVRQLLNMTSGMKNMDEGATLEKVLKQGLPAFQLPNTLDEMIEKYCSDTLVGEPGTKFDYNNAEYLLLGKIIETASGKSYEAYLKDQILIPLGLTNTGLLTPEKIIPKLADTYFFRDDINKLVSDLPVYISSWYGAGAMYSTVQDLAKFSNALFNYKIIKKETLQKMITADKDEYGFGVWIYNDYKIKQNKYTIVKRPGSIMGAQAMLFHILEKGTTIIILSNTGTVSLDDLVAAIAKKVIS